MESDIYVDLYVAKSTRKLIGISVKFQVDSLIFGVTRICRAPYLLLSLSGVVGDVSKSFNRFMKRATHLTNLQKFSYLHV